MSVVVTGGSPGSVYVVAECDPTAFTLLANGESPSDACDSRDDAVIAVDAGGAATVDMQPHAVLTTALGPGDCRSEQCFIAVESQYSTGGSTLLVQDISFASTACDSAKACALPADAWDPSLEASPRRPGVRPRPRPLRRPGQPGPRPRRPKPATPGNPTDLPGHRRAGRQPHRPGAVTGPYSVGLPGPGGAGHAGDR